ncbi:hypothetical protein [Romboutsia lituseburensis]|uniref:hypothetical protein n=1 Tax=Romboutsia lituseburensis TaxID=1537 RepID=UPI00215A966C|nr:hypothetical protein [Romboutsia lituseburensis]MCR8745439.1 hypothetical protein [Romboutsia lituseburensis]
MKKIITMVTILSIGLGAFVVFKRDNKVSYNKDQAFSASYAIPQDLEQLKEKSPIIVQGRFTGKREADKDKNIIGPSTISQFKVDEVYKGNIGKKTVSVIEPFEIEKKDFANIEGYIPMIENQDYVLFLRENDTEFGKQYTIISISFGKYNLSNENEVKEQTKEIKYFDEVKKQDFIPQSPQECKIYNNIKEDIVDNYKN